MEALAIDAPVAAPRGRPREFCTEAALAQALRVFWTRGYEGASLTELTEAMGVTRPSLYAAFGNKEQLFRKALDLYEREKLAFMQTALEAPTARGVAERLLTAAVEMQSCAHSPKGCLEVTATTACGAEAQGVRDEVVARRAAALGPLQARFRRAAAEGDFPADIEPEGLVRFLMAVMTGLAVQAGSGAGCAELRSLMDTTLKLWPGR
ncbi:MAG: TetR/AcrR family transcriptional regulator [Caulobacteraceae bacterium]|nr:TetR/AcrR family transcriptional regulator [Caulobacter sp.]